VFVAVCEVLVTAGVGGVTNCLPVIGLILAVCEVLVTTGVAVASGVGEYGLPVIGLTPVRGVAVLTCVSVAALLVTAP
jgi:hypothetical protein